MSKRNGVIFALLLSIVVVEVIILAPKEIGSPGDDLSADGKKAFLADGAGQVMKDFYSVEAKGDSKEWELWGARAVRPQDKQEWTIESVKAKFFASNGVVYDVRGDQGHVMPTGEGIRGLTVSGNVVTRSSNGYVFKSQSVNYDSLEKKLVSRSSIEMTAPPDKEGGQLFLVGKDMLADLSTNKIKIAQDVSASKKLKDGKDLMITSDRAVFSGSAKMAHFIGNVVLTFDTMVAKGPEARFSYDTVGEKLQSVIVDGGVNVTDVDKNAVGRTVNVDFEKDEVIFRGSPRVTQNGDELTGDEIVFLNGGHKVKVRNARAQFEPEDEAKGESRKSRDGGMGANRVQPHVEKKN